MKPLTSRSRLLYRLSQSCGHKLVLEVAVVAFIACSLVPLIPARGPSDVSQLDLPGRLRQKALWDLSSTADLGSLASCAATLRSATEGWNRRDVPAHDRALIVFHVGLLTEFDSFEMNAKNMRVFLSSLSANKLSDSTFIILNVVGGDENPLRRVIDDFVVSPDLSCSLVWNETESDLLAHSLTLNYFSAEARSFHGIIFLNNGVRGPMVRRREWVQDFLSHLRVVSLSGPVLSCEIDPHVPTHMFAISSDIIDFFLALQLDGHAGLSWSEIVKKYEVGFSQALLSAGEKIGSLLHMNRWHEISFNGTCRPEIGTRNVAFLCEPYYIDSLFLKFGGAFFRHGLFCDAVLSDVESTSNFILGAGRDGY